MARKLQIGSLIGLLLLAIIGWTAWADALPPDITVTADPVFNDGFADYVRSDTTVTIVTSDPDGVASCTYHVTIGGTTTDFNCLPSPATFTPYTGLADGTVVIESITAADNVGNSTTLDLVVTIIDDSPPTTTVVSGPSGFINDPDPEFDFHVDDGTGSGVDFMECTLSGPVNVGPVVCLVDPLSDDFVFLSDVLGRALAMDGTEDGAYTMTISATDNLGNVETTATYTWTYDSQPPELTYSIGAPIFSDGSNRFVTSGSIFDATGSDVTSGLALCEYSVDGGPFTSVPVVGGSCNLSGVIGDFVSGDGYHFVTVYFEDLATNGALYDVDFVLDDTPPTTTVVSGPGGFMNDPDPSFSFNVSDGSGSGIDFSECVLNGPISIGPIPCSSPLNLSDLIGSPLLTDGSEDGTYTLDVSSTDNLGNVENTATYTWTYDSQPPVLTSFDSTAAADGYINAAEAGAVDVTGTIVDNLSGVQTVFLSAFDSSGSSTPCVEVTLSASGVLSFTASTAIDTTSCLDGFGTVFLDAVDAAGNFFFDTTGISLFKDTIAPTSTVVFGPSTFTNDSNPLFVLDVDDGTGSGPWSIECVLSGPVSTGAVDCSAPFFNAGGWIYLSDVLGRVLTSDGNEDGTYIMSFAATDLAGNVETTATYNWTYDSQPPFATLLDSAAMADGFVNASEAGAVDVSFTFEDALAGIGDVFLSVDDSSVECVASAVVSSGGGTSPFNSSTTADVTPCLDGSIVVWIGAFDAAGNWSGWYFNNPFKDTQLPSITGSASPAPNTNGWNNTDVTVSFACTDPDKDGYNSGVAAGFPTGDTTLTAETSAAGVNVTGDCQDNAGNSASVTVGPIKIDKTAPSSAITSGPAEGSFTNQTTATFGFSATDDLSGVDFIECNLDGAGFSPCTSPLNLTGLSEGTHTLLVRATDLADNIESTATRTWHIDLTPPTLTASATAGSNPYTAGSWTNQDVTVSFSCTDPISNGVSSGVASVSGPTTLTTEGAGQSVTGTCDDVAGNSSSTTVSNINIDKTNPTIAFVGQNPAANAAGWNNTSVTLSWNCTDALSGPVSATVTQTLNGEGAGQSATGTCEDLAGNSAQDTQTGIDIDLTAPAFGAPARASGSEANAHGWNNSDVTVNFPCNDVLSGPVTATIQKTITTEGQNQTATALASECVDLADNVATSGASLGNINIDKTAPSSQITSGPAEGSFTNQTTATFEFTGADALSGVAKLQCNLDGGGFNDCTSPLTLSGLTEGTHTLLVRAIDNADNVESTASRTWHIDLTPPTLTASATADGSPYTAGSWTNQDVTVTFSCTDPVSNGVSSGVASGFPTGDTTLTAETSGTLVNGTCEDNVGNTTTLDFGPVKIDKTKPLITASRTPAPNPNGWNNTTVTVSFTCADTGSVQSGIATDTVAGATLSGEGANQSVTNSGDCIDQAGNAADTVTLGGINIDLTAPSSTITSGPAEGSFTNHTTATFGFSATDNLSGVDFLECSLDGAAFATCTSPLNLTGLAEGTHTLLVRATDLAGNVESTASRTWNVDLTPPQITANRTPGPNAFGWNNSDVTVSFTCTDPVSHGVSSGVATPPLSPQVVSAEGAGQSRSGTCTDVAGNSSTATVDNINIDKTNPTVTILSPPDGATFERDAAVTASFLTSDLLSGIDSVSSTVPDGSAIDTSTVGLHEFTVIATDRAGNTTTLTHNYQVIFLPPEQQEEVVEEITQTIEEQITQAIESEFFQSGDKIKICFTLTDPSTGEPITDAVIKAELDRVVDPDTGLLSFIRFLGEFEFDATTGQYCLEFETVDEEGNPLTPGLYELLISFNDGTTIRVRFTIS